MLAKKDIADQFSGVLQKHLKILLIDKLVHSIAMVSRDLSSDHRGTVLLCHHLLSGTVDALKDYFDQFCAGTL